MAFNSNGQPTYLVLDSLSTGSKYGLEIIEYISKKTGGNYIMKKPTLYSCLTRMEKKGLVSSSYWGESELGGKRHYYTITSLGKSSLQELAKEFENLTAPNETENLNTVETAQSSGEEFASKPVFLQQTNIFDLTKENSTPVETKIQETTLQKHQNDDFIENQLDLFSLVAEQITDQSKQQQDDAVFLPKEETFNTISSQTETEYTLEEQEKHNYYQNKLEQTTQPDQSSQNDARLLDENEHQLTKFQEEQNKRIYDTSVDLKKYRKRKSFSENQIEMSVVYENAEDIEIQKSRIEELKRSMLNLRGRNEQLSPSQKETTASQEDMFETSYSKIKENQQNTEGVSETFDEFETKDDAILISEPPIDARIVPIQRKIAPTNIEVNIYDDNLPAPKRNASLEPTYKDMMSKLFEKKKEKEIEKPQIIEEEFAESYSYADYDNLKRYYQTHGIEFKEYKKSSVERIHNTNFLQFVSSTILLLFAGVGSAVLFAIISSLKQLKTGTNFMFYTLPILFFVYMVYSFIKFKFYPSKKPNIRIQQIVVWAVFILASLIVLVCNIACGMQFESMIEYLTSITLPILGLLIVFPVNFYCKHILYKKFGK